MDARGARESERQLKNTFHLQLSVRVCVYQKKNALRPISFGIDQTHPQIVRDPPAPQPSCRSIVSSGEGLYHAAWASSLHPNVVVAFGFWFFIVCPLFLFTTVSRRWGSELKNFTTSNGPRGEPENGSVSSMDQWIAYQYPDGYSYYTNNNCDYSNYSYDYAGYRYSEVNTHTHKRRNLI